MKKTAKIISIGSGKGGVGKTSILTNLAIRFSQLGKKVLIFDGDLGMANVDIFFGIRTDLSIYDAINQRRNIKDILVEVHPGVFLIPGGSGMVCFNHLTAHQRQAMMDQLSQIPEVFDIILVDTSPGISENVLYLNYASDETCIVVTPDPASIADSYALIKVLNRNHKRQRFNLICNMVKDEKDGLLLFERFSNVTDRFLNVGLTYLGSVPMDSSLRKANFNQRLIIKQDPSSLSSMGLSQIASSILSLRGTPQSHSNTFFWEQAIGVA